MTKAEENESNMLLLKSALAEIEKLKVENKRLKPEPQAQSVEADGYVAWNSKYNYYAPFFERHGEWEAWKTLISYIDPDFFKTLNKLAKEKNNHWFQGNHGEKVDRFPEQVKLEWDEKRRGIEMSGWQIRPVKLQFTDQPQQPTARELLQALREWCARDNADKTRSLGGACSAYALSEFAEQWLKTKESICSK